ncbi:helix-turn-helix domain-containing protein [Winogradskyella algicola]|uniref:helix-turn-helix domain-containing protein n=1 Tax=Winogradskyella algicola TaxID=2575815 RepID=UPI001108CADF|nr:helix-turn-helix transcriptional regulator [Winogradskyella algicola]
MKIEEKLGLKIKQLRNEIGISQEELAYRCDLHRTYISSVELGKRNISIRNIEKIALALNVEIIELFKKGTIDGN